ncbi:hypothetical protein ACJJTC_010118 [Scirpophaga incertulas]
MDKPGPSKKRELRKQKMLSLKRELIGQQAMFTKPIQDSEAATEVSYEISRMIAKRSRPFNDGDFVKECIEIAAKKMCPEAAKKFEKIQLNRMTIQRRIMSLSVENAPESMQLHIIDIQNDQDLRNKFNEGDLLNFYRCLDKNTYKELRINALKCASLFGSTYICEQTFSILNNNKTKNRNRLANESLEAVLRVATSKFEPNIKKIVSTMQCHASN